MLVGLTRKGAKEHDVPWRELVEYHAEHPALTHLLPEPQAFVEQLTQHAVRSGPDRMFWIRAKTLRFKMGDLCALLDVPHHTPHELRHSCASNLVNRGQVPIQIVQELLNHESINTTRNYVDVSASALRDWRRATLGAREASNQCPPAAGTAEGLTRPA
jgi:integrase